MSQQISQERILLVLQSPIVSEKATFVAEKNEQVVFKVSVDATKAEVKAAVEALFKVEVESVQTVNVLGKTKRTGRFSGRRKNWKKAYVSLKPNQQFNLVEGGEIAGV